MSEDYALGEETEEIDVLSLMASQSDEDDENETDDDDDTEDTEVLKERVAKRNKSLKKSKQAVHRLQDENKSLMDRLDKLEGLVNSKNDGQSNTVDAAKLEQQAQEWMDRVADNPAEAIKYADWKQAQLEQGLNNWATKFEERMMSKIGVLEGVTNPERIKYENEVAILKQNPDFEGYTDEQLIPFAKMLKNTKVRRPPGTVGGKRASEQKEKRFALTPEEKAQMGF